MVVRHIFILAIIALTAAFPASALTMLQASVDRNPVMEGESLILTVTADDDLNSGKLDTSSLLKDFIVGRTSISRSKQIMNFDASNETRWQVLLSPRNIGTITIPAFTIDGVSSKPIPLSVLKTGSQPQQMQDIFMRANLSSEQAYVGQMLTYKVKLYLALELQRGVLNAPNLEGAQIKQLGEDKDSTDVVNGRRYRVIERNYAIIADQPGELTIDGASFAGDVVVQSRRNGAMFSFNESRPTQTQAPKMTVSIKPIPADYQGQWLVADLVVLKEDWPETQNEFKVGDPITRTINLLASNADETSLPEIVIKAPSALKVYPEKPQRNTFLRDNQMVSQLTQTTAIVATQAGTYTLPEIKVPWWNPHLNKQQFATLPARTITVTAGAAIEPLQPQVTTHSSNSDSGFWPWLSLVLGCLWVITLLLWQKERRNKQAAPNIESSAKATKPHSGLTNLQTACHAKDPTGVLNALTRYYSELYQAPMTLSQIAATDSRLSDCIGQLQQSAYGSNQQASNVDFATILSIAKMANTDIKQAKASVLTKLNPS
ncbi:BatD family protein [uncultured Shewanella sp.]|uniref:BatD family protein n=1 Tax=uncultured Shewanella sp. TaxID=173975 RepID=UPI00262F621F|nr:BatD family protein [uncultured Shewanella sp.]